MLSHQIPCNITLLYYFRHFKVNATSLWPNERFGVQMLC